MAITVGGGFSKKAIISVAQLFAQGRLFGGI
jgi:hypothetical protein